MNLFDSISWRPIHLPMFLLVNIFIGLVVIDLSAQSHARAPKEKISRVDSIIMNASKLAMTNKDSSILLLKDLADDLENSDDDNTVDLGNIYHAMAEIFYMTTESRESIRYYNKSITFIQDEVLKAKYKLRVASNYIELGELDSAKVYLDVAEIVTLNSGRDIDKMFLYQTMSNYYKSKNQLITALDYQQKAYKSIRDIEGYEYAKISILRELGIIQNLIGNTEGALSYFNKGFELAREKELNLSMASMNRYLGDIYFKEKNYEEALKNYRTSLKHYLKNSNRTMQLVVGSNISRIYIFQNKLDKAQAVLDSMDQIKLDYEPIIFNYLFAKAEWAKTIKAFDQSKSFYTELIREARQNNSNRVVMYSMYGLSDCYRLEGDQLNSLKYYERYQALKDSVFSLNQTNILSDYEAKYQRANQEMQITELNLENEKQIQELVRRERQILFIGVLFLSILIIGLQLYFAYRSKLRYTKELGETNHTIAETLDKNKTLMKEIHHRVKNNLQVISSLLNLQSRQITDFEAKAAIVNSQNRIRSMSMIHQDIYLDEEIKSIDLGLYINNLVRNLSNSFKSESSGLKFNFKLDKTFVEIDDAIPIGLIYNELITYFIQSLKEEQSKGITVGLDNTDDHLKVTVSSDQLISEQDFLQDDNLGYKIVRSFTAKWKADIQTSEKDGYVVSIHIPKTKLLGQIRNSKAS